MVDIARDPRWGRIAESAGEDTWYGSQVAKAMVKGYQGNDLRKDNAILACVKHFALYGAAEAGRDYNTTDMSRIRMYQDYLPPYKAAIDAGAGSVMTSFNEVDGIPATGNSWLMKDLLRKQWGFNGLLVTDYGAIGEMTAHGSGNMQEVSALALQAGVDMDMMSDGFVATLQRSVKEGKVTLQQIDAACTRVLEVKYSLGLFDDPYKNCKEENAARYILSTENKAAAREVAEHSFVLLKNASNTLPLQKKGSIALIGPLADDQRNLIGNWSAAGDYTQSVSVKEGLSKLIGTAAQLQYAKGANLLEDENMIRLLNASRGEITKDSRSAIQLLQEAVALAKNSDVVVAVLGETQGMTGEAACRTNLGIPENQQQLLRALVQTGKPVVLVLMSGRPLTLTWEDAHVSAILETWFAGTEAGNAIANVLFGAYNPAGRLTATFPRSVGQIPLYYNHKNTGRPFDSSTQSMEKYKSRYIDESNDPLYPFGYGLSYTTFSYSSVRLSKASLQGNETLTASVTVTNTGSYAGEEVVQLYLSDPVASVTRPVKELKNFKKLLLQPGESKQVSFTITTEDLKFYNSNLQYVWEPGQFKVYIGTNSQTGNAASVQWNK
jgi:beta-glucosidase